MTYKFDITAAHETSANPAVAAIAAMRARGALPIMPRMATDRVTSYEMALSGIAALLAIIGNQRATIERKPDFGDADVGTHARELMATMSDEELADAFNALSEAYSAAGYFTNVAAQEIMNRPKLVVGAMLDIAVGDTNPKLEM